MRRGSIALGFVGAAWAALSWMGCATGVEIDPNGDGGDGGESTTSTSGGGQAGVGGQGGSGIPVDCLNALECAALGGPCSIGTCVNGKCESAPANQFGSCDDGLFCTENDVCEDGQCVGGTQRYCSSLDNCHVGVCDEDLDTCKNIAGNDGGQCDDGDNCTGTGYCSAGVCNKGSQVDCSIFNGPCSVGICDPASGCKAQSVNEGTPCDNGQFSPCSYGQCKAGTCLSLPMNDGAACDDGDFNPCSQGTCQNAQCVSAPSAEGDPCDDQMFNPCTWGTCQMGLCISGPANNGAFCDDFQFCTIGETCLNGACLGGKPNPCAPPGGCWIATCDENFDVCNAMPGNNGAACDDGNLCTDGTVCSNGACIGGAPVNDGAMCNDGASCTNGEFCTAGVCGGGMGPTIYFADDFSDNAQGWSLGAEWQIGFAMPSSNGVFGADPAADHSSTADNGVAGVVIGGNASTNLHSYYWLESPPFNTQNAAGQVIFGFYRWLNSDYDPYMHNAVEVWNGVQWINLWTSGGPPGVEDSPPNGMGWTYISYDVTAYKNAGMRVRFGFDITSAGVYTIGSWNLDDVLVASTTCP